jgi:hypothetical protein
MRARPAAVLGPVDNPPWKRHLRLPGSTLTAHGLPCRLRAPQTGPAFGEGGSSCSSNRVPATRCNQRPSCIGGWNRYVDASRLDRQRSHSDANCAKPRMRFRCRSAPIGSLLIERAILSFPLHPQRPHDAPCTLPPSRVALVADRTPRAFMGISWRLSWRLRFA